MEKNAGSNFYWSEGEVHFLKSFLDVLLPPLSPLPTRYTWSTTIVPTILFHHFEVVEKGVWQVEGHMTVAMQTNRGITYN